jgi:hypothetical protein
MRDLTIQILTKNNEKTIKNTLESILPLNSKIVVIDLGSKDQTCKIAEYYGCDIIKKSIPDDYSKLRNEIIEQSLTDWNFYIEPYEKLVYGKEINNIIDKNQSGIYFAKVFRGETLTKDIRIWHKTYNLKFKNPVYECLFDERMQDSNCIIYSKNTPNLEELLKQVKNWKKKHPISNEPYYYEACLLLSQGKYDEFIKLAEIYLFKDKEKVMPITMIRYYCAVVHCHIKKNADLAARYIVPCIAVNPLMRLSLYALPLHQECVIWPKMIGHFGCLIERSQEPVFLGRKLDRL